MPPTNFHNAKPETKTNPIALFKTYYAGLFDKIRRETDETERERLIKRAKKLAKRANISLPRREFEK